MFGLPPGGPAAFQSKDSSEPHLYQDASHTGAGMFLFSGAVGDDEGVPVDPFCKLLYRRVVVRAR